LTVKCFDLVNQNNVIEASKVLDTALEKITLADINKSAVFRIKNNLESRGETFKYDTDILEKKVSDIILFFKYFGNIHI